MIMKSNKSKIVSRICCIVIAVLVLALFIITVIASTRQTVKAESVSYSDLDEPLYTLSYDQSINRSYFRDLGISFELAFFDIDLFLSNPYHATDPKAGEYYLTYGDCKYFDTYSNSIFISRPLGIAPYRYLGEVVKTTPSSKFPLGYKYNTNSFPDFNIEQDDGSGLGCNFYIAIPVDQLPEDRNVSLYFNLGVELRGIGSDTVFSYGDPISPYLGKFFACDFEIDLNQAWLADAEVVIFTGLASLNRYFVNKLRDYFPDMDKFSYTLLNLVPYVDCLHYLDGTPFTGKEKIDFTMESNLPYDNMVFSPEWRYATYDWHNSQLWAEAYDAGRKRGREEVSGSTEESYNNGYQEGYVNGLNKGQSDLLASQNPLSYFFEPVQSFLDTPFFGRFSFGSVLGVFLFVSLAIIFLRMFSGG